MTNLWAAADSATLRLPPTAFSRLPGNIVQHLQRRGCTIPQTYLSSEPHNVISGEFTRRGQRDWAVLCSRNKESSILVFRRGSATSVLEVAKTPDRSFLQTITEGGKIGFSRMIGAVDRDYIFKQDEAYAGPKPPRIQHQGINDVFVGKASVVHYYYRRKWLELQGAD
ncbi:MAG: hypothetical protein KF868_14855 [Acidobacteria bacterium]|nr:hypothetical protein [Acidobacteriota bacterium]MCW5970608.1 hypothetical protein [Blastocatellales bacterium]